jgi:hypothetical protein
VFLRALRGLDRPPVLAAGTRTRDLRRDRPTREATHKDVEENRCVWSSRNFTGTIVGAVTGFLYIEYV